MSNTNKEVSEYGLVNRIMARLGLGEVGHLNSYVKKMIKNAESEIKKIEHNQATAKMTNAQVLSKLEEDLEDANEDLEAVYENIPLEKISNNSAQHAYMAVHIAAIDRASEKVEGIEESIEDEKASFRKLTEDNKLQVKAYKARIEKFKQAKA